MPNRSPIREFVKEFSVDEDLVVPNTFRLLGTTSKGRCHYVIFNAETLDYNRLSILHEHPIKHSMECVQYLIKGIEGTILGSLFDVNKKKSYVTSFVLSVDDTGNTKGKHSCDIENGTGGVYTYNDSKGSTVAVPQTLEPNSFVVQ